MRALIRRRREGEREVMRIDFSLENVTEVWNKQSGIILLLSVTEHSSSSPRLCFSCSSQKE